MGEGIKIGSNLGVLLDGVEYKGELKLSTKYQWVDDKDVRDLCNDTSQEIFPVFVEYKGETHAFLKNSKEHKKLVNGVWTPDVEQPDDKFQSSAYYADNNYIYSLRVRDLYKFDGTNWTLVYTIPTKSTYDETRYPETATGDKYNGEGDLNFIVKNNKVYCNIKTKVYYSRETYNFYYLGYIDLLTLAWVNLPSAPSNDYIGYSKFGFIGSTIYMFCAKPSAATNVVYMLDEAETAWTQTVSRPIAVHWMALGTLSIAGGIYVVDGVELLYFDGSTFETISDTNQVTRPNLVFHNNELHLFYIRNIPYNTPDSNSITYIRRPGVHKVLKKVLCLEV